MSGRSAGSWIRDRAKVAGVTPPSASAAATRYGMLWSAVSRVAGSHFSASAAVRRTAAEAEKWDPATQETRSEEHTSELQSPCNIVCRLLLEKKNTRLALTPSCRL